MRFEKTRKFDCAKTMPTLRHRLDGEPFDIDRSEVIDWLCEQPEIRQYVFDKARSAGAIVYDAESGTWSGADS